MEFPAELLAVHLLKRTVQALGYEDNAIGQVVERNVLQANSGNTVIKVSSNEWAAGVYQIEFRDVNTQETITKRFIKN